ncbi:MAG: DNA-3-methyladenine glycosylase I [Rhodospirillales bacterium]|nr:DNA-3-methyladenine glycosylase I [Alphaproteobacteria bacterium]USO04333.1 MAG: DNA-3-methyladenine glycosylase I [Rhodospirillales bacterium]
MNEAGLIEGPDGRLRCWWHGNDPGYLRYHDEEWGRPVCDDTRLFEKLCLEGFQAGLSWLTILRKRENFRKAFAGFAFEKVAKFTGEDVERLMRDAGIIRHRGKIEAAINNAQRTCELVGAHGSLAAYFWSFEPPDSSRPALIDYRAVTAMTTSPESVALSKDLKKRGFRFVGPTTMYAHMQAMGLVNDHVEGCFCRKEVEDARRAFLRPVSAAR